VAGIPPFKRKGLKREEIVLTPVLDDTEDKRIE
jgi:hypothetical protein